MVHPSYRKRRLSSDDRQGVIMLCLAGAVLLAFAGVAAYAVMKPERNAQTGCLGEQAELQHVVVVDRTDRLTEATSGLVAEAMKAIGRSVRVDERLTLVPFTGKADKKPTTTFDRCRVPGRNDGSRLYEDVDANEATFVATYLKPLEAEIAAMAKAGDAPETALVPFLGQLVSELKYKNGGKRLAVHVFSNLGEFTEGINLVGKKPTDKATFREYMKRHLGERVQDVEFIIHVLPTSATPPVVAKRIKEYWAEGFAAAGARVTWSAL